MRADTALKFAAFALAMQIKAGTDTAQDHAALRRQLGRFPWPEKPLAQAVTGFCDRLDEAATRADRHAAADALAKYVDHMNVPTPPDIERKDIHG